jgi:tetratricopeptide (TPR) repeat protein
MQRKLLGSDHPDVAKSLSGLADVLAQRGKLVEAEAMHLEALAMQRKLLGNEHPAVSTSIKNLVRVLRDQGKVAEAEAMLREELAQRRKDFGNEHPSVARTLSQLADLRISQDKLAEAEATSRQALAIDRKSAVNLGNMEESIQSLAETLFRQSKYAEAEPLYRELVERRHARLSDENVDLLGSISSLAGLLADWAWSESGWKAKPQNWGRTNGSRQPGAASVSFSTGGSRPKVAERAREAERILRDCLTRHLGRATVISSRIAEVRSRLGYALLVVTVTDSALNNQAQLLKLTESEALMLEGNNVVQRDDKVENHYKRAALTRLVRLYQVWDKPAQAAEWQRKLANFDQAAAKPASKEESHSTKP